jgi:DNA-binding transcriptional ArsR family regulator
MVQTALAALAAPNRLRIVELLRDGPQPVNDIAERLALSQPQASKHLRVLRSAGLVAVAPRAQQRLYALRPEPFREFHAWIEQFRRIWEARFDALDDLLKRMQRKESKG